jgi:hypothetical protein
MTHMSVSANTWYHVEFVHTTAARSLYINGQLMETNASNFTPAANNGDFTVGGIAYDFPGYMDDVRVYNYARTPAQVAWDYNRGGPVAWYKLSECSDVIAHDNSGNSLNGTITIGGNGTQDAVGTCDSGDTGDAWYNGRNGKFSSAMSFDGEDDYVSVPDTANLDANLKNMSISLWAYIRTEADWSFLLAKMTGDSSSKSYGFYLDNSSPHKKLVFSLNTDSDGGASVSNNAVTLNSWMHIVGIWDGSRTKLYVNGILQNDFDYCGGTNIKDTANNLVFGASSDLSGGNWFNGLIDDVRIYNYALTQEQVKTVYNGGSAVQFSQ